MFFSGLTSCLSSRKTEPKNEKDGDKSSRRYKLGAQYEDTDTTPTGNDKSVDHINSADHLNVRTTKMGYKYVVESNGKGLKAENGLSSDHSDADNTEIYQSPDDLESPSMIIREGFDEEISDLKAKVYTRRDWIKILKNNDLDNTSTTELYVSLRHGIPFQLRPRIWQFLASTQEAHRTTIDGYYLKLSKILSKDDDTIKRDLFRTFPDNVFFTDPRYEGAERLRRILRAYASFDPDVGYTQGMNVVAASLLIILHPEHYSDVKTRFFERYAESYEENVFWILVHLMHEKNWRSIYKPGTPKVIEMTRYFEKMLYTQIREVHDHIISFDLEIGTIFHEMFITLLLMNAPLAIGKRILDVFLIEGEKLIFKVLLRAVSLCKKHILSIDDPVILNNYIRKQMFYQLLDKYKKRLYVLFPFPEAENF